jgi:hypothetical protein
VLVASGGMVARGVWVAAGVLVGATSAVIVSAEEKVDTAKVWIWFTDRVGVASGAFPPPHEASRIAPSAKNICTFIIRVLIIHTPFKKYRNNLKVSPGVS